MYLLFPGQGLGGVGASAGQPAPPPPEQNPHTVSQP